MKNNVTNFLELHNTIYAAAVATVRMSDDKIERKKPRHLQTNKQTPLWERRFKKLIDDLRKDIGKIKQAQRGKTSNIIQKHIRRIREKYTYTYTPNTIQAMPTHSPITTEQVSRLIAKTPN